MGGSIGSPVPEDRLNEVAELAEIVAEMHCPKDRVDLEAIARVKHITISYGRYADSFDGLLEHDAGRFHIYCNIDRVQAKDSGRARFVLGHELGHFFLDDHRNALATGIVPSHPSQCDFQSRNPVEVEADHFSAALLMPTNKFLRAAQAKTRGLGAILSLAEQFGTSVTSTALRYVRLNVGPCAFVKWNPDGFAWKWCSPSMTEAGYRGTIRDPDKVPLDAPTGRAFSGEQPPNAQFFHSGTVASAWFPSTWLGSHRDIILIEEAIRLGRFGVLTMLYPDSQSIR